MSESAPPNPEPQTSPSAPTDPYVMILADGAYHWAPILPDGTHGPFTSTPPVRARGQRATPAAVE